MFQNNWFETKKVWLCPPPEGRYNNNRLCVNTLKSPSSSSTATGGRKFATSYPTISSFFLLIDASNPQNYNFILT